jgi:D-alanyl-D-alanine carboxypeptidase/D-alanyl-D-alanine-endopeptidase (penicillin-binding protein 4)
VGEKKTRRVGPSILFPGTLFPLLPLLGLTGGCVTFPFSGQPALEDEIEEILRTPPLNQVNWGIRIADPDRGEILYSRNAHRKFVPASNMKVLATSTALSLLGPEYRYETDFYGVGSMGEDPGVLEGDLLLRASGDPTLSERFYPSAEAPLDSLARGLWESGLRSVTGSLVVDVSTWDSTTVPGSWMVQNLAGVSGATGGAFSIAEGVLTVEVTAGAEAGSPAQARWWPHSEEDFVSVQMATVERDTVQRRRTVEYLPESRRLRIQGAVETGRVDTIRIGQRDPVRLASAAMLRALERQGVRVRGGVRIAWDRGERLGPGTCTTGSDDPPDQACEGAVRLTGISSPPMSKIVKAILEPSQNWMTEQLVKTLGAERGEGGSWQEGFAIEEKFLAEEVGVDSLDVFYQDGSGLSAYNLVTPRAMVRILEYMRTSPHATIFKDALASPGEEPGTLSRRLLSLEGRVFAKTGTINHVNSLSGYLITDSGRELIFSILTNGSGISSALVRAGIDQVVETLARR